MCITELVTLIKDILVIIGVLFGVYLSIKLYLQFAPDIIFRITPIWSDISRDIVVLKIEIENKSNVRLNKSRIRLKINRHVKSSLKELTEWVDMDENAEEISKTTRLFYPGSVLKIDRLYRCNENEVIQGIIQFEGQFSGLHKFLANIRGGKETWTNTFIITR